MDEDDEELLVRLCTRIGVIMEDASYVALTIRGTDGAERKAAIAQIATATEMLTALTGAAVALASATERKTIASEQLSHATHQDHSRDFWWSADRPVSGSRHNEAGV